jgi:hypothetical protein
LLAAIPATVPADVFVRDDIITTPAYNRFSVCFEHSCEKVVTLSLSLAEWQMVISPLSAPSFSPASERDAIAAMLSNMETVVGMRTGTDQDKARNLTGFGLPGQMDCIDESTNTTTYLTMLAETSLLKHHTIMDRSTRFGLFSLPHTTAVIRETDTNRRFAVDSWFHDNGQAPVIIDFILWKSGWNPAATNNE